MFTNATAMPRSTATSAAEGRLKVDAGKANTKKRSIIKKVMGKTCKDCGKVGGKCKC
jgi:hypothetical protein